MSRSNLYRSAGCLILVLGLATFAVGDPPPPKNQPAPKDQTAKDGASVARRLVYIVKHGTAKDLASVLSQHFKGVAEIQALPDPSNNCLLISAAPSAFDEVVQVLEKLDRRPQTVSVEILIAQVAMKKADGDKTAPEEEVDEKDFTGAMSDIKAKVMGLQKKGVFTDVKRIQFTAVEGRPQSVLLGESQPYVTGVNTTATGRVSRNLQYRSAGTEADATVHVSPEKVVTVDLKLEDSHPYTPEDGIPLGTDENGKPILATEFALSRLASKLDVPSGKAQAAQGVKTVAKSGKAQTIVVVGATVVEPDAKPEK
jgi:Bacterial type II/III secretion system short domain